MKMICQILRVPYLGYTCYHYLRVGGQTYTAFSTHGSSNAGTLPGKLNAAIRASYHADVDIVFYGHTHGLATTNVIMEMVDKRNKSIVTMDKNIVLTGSFLEYRGSYAEMKGYQPVQTGTALAVFESIKHKIRVNV